MSLPGFSLARMGPVRIGGDWTAAGDFSLWDYFGQPAAGPPISGLTPPLRIVLENDFVVRGTDLPGVEDPLDSSTWNGAFRTGLGWRSGQVFHIQLTPGAQILGLGGAGGDALWSVSLGGTSMGSGGGGSGTPVGAAGYSEPTGTPGTAGTALERGSAGLEDPTGSPGGAGGAATAGLAGGHGMIVDDGTIVNLENYGTIRGGGAGGNGGGLLTGAPSVDGWAGCRAEEDWTDQGVHPQAGFMQTTTGRTGAAVIINDQSGAPDPKTAIDVLTPFTYPTFYGFLYRDGFRGRGGASPNARAAQ